LPPPSPARDFGVEMRVWAYCVACSLAATLPPPPPSTAFASCCRLSGRKGSKGARVPDVCRHTYSRSTNPDGVVRDKQVAVEGDFTFAIVMDKK